MGCPSIRELRRFIINKIQQKECTLLAKQSLTRTIYKVIIDNEIKQLLDCNEDYLVVVYDNKRHKLVTVLNPYYSEGDGWWRLNLHTEVIKGVR